MIGKTVLITGAARRLGRAIALDLHAAGANIVLHYRTARHEACLLAESMNALRADSLERMIEIQSLYLDNVAGILSGTMPLDSIRQMTAGLCSMKSRSRRSRRPSRNRGPLIWTVWMRSRQDVCWTGSLAIN